MWIWCSISSLDRNFLLGFSERLGLFYQLVIESIQPVQMLDLVLECLQVLVFTMLHELRELLLIVFHAHFVLIQSLLSCFNRLSRLHRFNDILVDVRWLGTSPSSDIGQVSSDIFVEVPTGCMAFNRQSSFLICTAFAFWLLRLTVRDTTIFDADHWVCALSYPLCIRWKLFDAQHLIRRSSCLSREPIHDLYWWKYFLLALLNSFHDTSLQVFDLACTM